jgi:hypothetical protein
LPKTIAQNNNKKTKTTIFSYSGDRILKRCEKSLEYETNFMRIYLCQ